MVPLSLNDWPSLSSTRQGAPSPQSNRVIPHSTLPPPSTQTSMLPQHNVPFQYRPSAFTPPTTYIAPPPGLQNHINAYPQREHQDQYQYQQAQMYNNNINVHNVDSLPMDPNLVFARQNGSQGSQIKSSPNVKYSTPLQSSNTISQSFSHSQSTNGIPQRNKPPPMAPPGLLPPTMTQNEIVSAPISQVPMLKRQITSSDQISSSILDSQSTILTSPNISNSPSQKSIGEQVEIKSPFEGPLDKYAPTYVPSWLRQVNEEVHFTLVPLPEEPNYDYDSFVSCFLPRSLIFSDPDEEEKERSGDAKDTLEEEKDKTEDSLAEEKGDLVKVDSTWLKGQDDDTLQELEDSTQSVDGEDQRPNSAHASIGAHSQALVISNVTPATHTASPPVQQKLSKTQQLAAPLPPFGPEKYSERLKRLLEAEYSHRRDMLTAQSLYDVQLSVYPPEVKGETALWSKEHLYGLRLPGIREDYPNLVTGDLLQLRVLASQTESWLRIAFEAKVHVVHKVAGLVILKCDALASQLKTLFKGIESARFNILFSTSAFRGSSETVGGVERLGKYLKRSHTKPGQVLQRWLFPMLKDQEDQTKNKASVSIKWYDANLNSEQKGIVHSILSSSLCKIPFLIHGPPGTGKTKTLVELTLQILQHNARPRILLTAPSVTAADTLALRLSSQLSPREMTRINDPRRTFEEVPEALLIYCSIEEANGSSRFGLPEWQKLIRSKVVIMATQDIHILHLCKVSNLELGRWQGITLSAMLGEDNKMPAPLHHWTHLIVDEAGQSNEAEIANALLLVVPSIHHDVDTSLPVVVLCGDVAQLGPQIDSHFARSHGLDISLLERLSKRKVYHRQLSLLRSKARQALLRGDFGTDEREKEKDWMTSSGNAAHLVRNYRARNASLLHVVSMLFYDDCLLPCALPSTLQLEESIFPNRQVPLLFEHVDSKDEWVDEGASFYNAGEIEKVVELCKLLTKQERGQSFTPKDIAVITPYREQVWRIRLKLRKEKLAGISVGNVEVYQGAEHKVTILSTVRSSSKFLKMDARRSLGLVYERKRLCVALSRAQEALIVVGNAELLRLDPYWRSFISYAKRNLILHGEIGKNEDEDNEQVGALEYAARLDKASSEKDTAYLAGRMAASALYEEEDQEEDDDDAAAR